MQKYGQMKLRSAIHIAVQPRAPSDWHAKREAQRHSGYQLGGTSPFGTRKAMPIYVERSVLALPRICINGGRRGYLVGIEPWVLIDQLAARPVDCATGGAFGLGGRNPGSRRGKSRRPATPVAAAAVALGAE